MVGLESIEKGGYLLMFTVVIGVVLVILIGVSYINAGANQKQLQAAINTTTTGSTFVGIGGASPNAITQTAANSLILTLSGAYTWISGTTPLTLTITGQVINVYATNSISANTIRTGTQVFTVYSAIASNTLTATTGNFYSITSITLAGMTAGAYPSFTAIVTQPFVGEVLGSNTLAANSISASAIGTATYTAPGILANYTTNAGNIANTGGSNANYVYYILFAALIIGVVIGVLVGVTKKQ